MLQLIWTSENVEDQVDNMDQLCMLYIEINNLEHQQPILDI